MLVIIFSVVTLLVGVQSEVTTAGPVTNESQLLTQIENSLKQINSYIIEFLELIVRLVKAVTQYINDIQSGNATAINISHLTASIKSSFNTSSDNCTSAEELNISVLLKNTSRSIQLCYSDVNNDLGILLPEIENLLIDLIGSLTNSSDGFNNCFKSNPLLVGLPGCIMNEVNYVKKELEIVTQELNSTISKGLGTVNEFLNDTKGCLSQNLSQFSTSFGSILSSFVECVVG